MADFFTWQMLATQAGATIATGLLTQALKGSLQRIPTRLLSYVTALVILLAANFFGGTLDVASGFLLAINAVVVSLASNGGFDALAQAKKIE